MSEAVKEPNVLVERDGPVVVITLNRPSKLNAWNRALEAEYFDALAAADNDPDVRAIVVTGAGRGFCAGADMADLAQAGQVTAADLATSRPRHFPLTMRKPLIGAVNGVAAGLGFVETLYFDVRFASPQALFLTSFAGRGLIAEYAISWLLPRIVGRSRAVDLLISGRRVDGEEALRLGLVDHLVPADDLLDAAKAYAHSIAAASSPTSVSVIKSQVLADATRSFAEAAAHAETLMLESFAGPDVIEGVRSFEERRSPRFFPLPARSTHGG